jgi:hypothetical protein
MSVSGWLVSHAVSGVLTGMKVSFRRFASKSVHDWNVPQTARETIEQDDCEQYPDNGRAIGSERIHGGDSTICGARHKAFCVSGPRVTAVLPSLITASTAR